MINQNNKQVKSGLGTKIKKTHVNLFEFSQINFPKRIIQINIENSK